MSQQLVPPPCTGEHAAWHCESEVQLPQLPPSPPLLPEELPPLVPELLPDDPLLVLLPVPELLPEKLLPEPPLLLLTPELLWLKPLSVPPSESSLNGG
jgi:hypothetical protein